MNYKSSILAAAFLLTSSCAGTDARETTVDKPTGHIAGNNITDTSSYSQIGNPDTALAIFMFKECYHYDYDLQREEYIRWDLEHNKLQPLVDSLFHDRKDYEQRMLQVGLNKTKFLEDARKVITSDARQYNVISDMMEFEYLQNRKDSLLKGLMSDMLKDAKVGKEEKLALEAALRKW